MEWKTAKIPDQDKVYKQIGLTYGLMEDIKKQFEKEGLMKEFEKIKEYFEARVKKTDQ